MAKGKLSLQFTKELFQLIKPHWRMFGFAMLALLLGSAMNLILPQIAKLMLDDRYSSYIIENPLLTCFGLLLIFALQNMFFYQRSYLFSSVGIKVGAGLRESLFASLIRKPLPFHDTQNWADIRSRLINDVQLIQDAVSLRLSIFLRYSIQVLLGAGCMLYLSPRLALYTLAIIPVLIVLGAVFGKRLKKLSVEAQQKLAVSTSDVEEGLGQIRLFKSLRAEMDLICRFAEHNQASARSSLLRSSFASFFASFMNFLLTLTVVLVLLYGLFLVRDGSLSTADFTAFTLYGAIVAVSFAFTISGYSELIQASAAGDRIFPLLQADNQSEAVDGRGFAGSQLRSDSADKSGLMIDFENVSFEYPSRPGEVVIKNLSCKLETNSCAAIVGASGGGKSTMVSLLLGLYQASSGKILINGIDLKEMQEVFFKASIAFVPQDGFLMSGSIRENLCLGAKAYSDQDLIQALSEVGLGTLISELDNGLDSQLGERGSQLSGGQRQRLAIARALLKRPAILILDEATSALDAENERSLLELVKKIKKTTTVILITHRLSTVEVADRIFVVVKGRLVQQGNYQEVVLSPGVFKSMLDTAVVDTD